jgi:hypothetical protein
MLLDTQKVSESNVCKERLKVYRRMTGIVNKVKLLLAA